GTGAWFGIILSLLLAGSYTGGAFSGDTDGRWISLHLLALMVVGWLGAPASPLMANSGMRGPVYYPLTTAAFALATALIGRRFVGRRRMHGVSIPGEEVQPLWLIRHWTF